MNRIEHRRRARLLRLEASTRERREIVALEASLAQTVRLAERRGEDVEHTASRVRIWSRDGLRALYDGGALAFQHYEAGLLYRSCLEASEALPGMAYGQVVGGGRATDGGHERAWRLAKLATMEGLPRTSREATTLRLVAGEGRALRSLSGGGADYALNAKALRTVLDRIIARLGL